MALVITTWGASQNFWGVLGQAQIRRPCRRVWGVCAVPSTGSLLSPPPAHPRVLSGKRGERERERAPFLVRGTGSQLEGIPSTSSLRHSSLCPFPTGGGSQGGGTAGSDSHRLCGSSSPTPFLFQRAGFSSDHPPQVGRSPRGVSQIRIRP